MTNDRREFLRMAAALGAAVAWSGPARASRLAWREREDLYPEGVASGDPDSHSVILWTRRPYAEGVRRMLSVEVAEDREFRRVVARARTPVSAAADWTTRVLVGGLRPSRVYWYRFADVEGNGSRVGRTVTAPREGDPRPVTFAFVSCQSINEGKLNGYRRMIFEDERAKPEDQLGFVLHLGDFIYEVLQYPEEGGKRFDRTIYEVARFPDGGRPGKLHYPLTLEGYRACYRGFLADPDLKDARARWPFVAIWDNHEFSWQGWQSILKQGGPARPGQTLKVAANQAWWEYLPSRCRKAAGASWDTFDPPTVQNVKIERWDADGLGDEPNNLAAINSLIGYRAFRYGRHLELLITDQHSYRSASPFEDPALDKLTPPEFLGMFQEDAAQTLDGGRTFGGGRPPAELTYGGVSVPNPQKDAPPQTILGAEQKAWFKARLKASRATWKIWGNSKGTLVSRADPQNLPPGMAKPWPGDFAILAAGDHSTAYAERAEICDLVRDAGITGFAIVSGDRHSFWAGYASAQLPPGKFEPVGLSFIGGSLSSPGGLEAYEHTLKKDHPLRPLFLADRPGAAKPDPTFNMLLKHGVRACLEYARSFDAGAARALSNPALAPHLEFVDMGGHGYATVRLSADEMRTEFVCIPRPIARSERPDGGDLRYRVVHTARLWKPGERPRLVQEVLEGDPGLSV
ncbi:MAG: alkaline phosphatase D family protein [Phenylobacterium sp.]|uniref:alkaline phosphatase D family protein n=1 Tax=Phenylobacterium sp. TaxID=1871053 RepID=UPI001A566BC0|nr:alkaline phosphatase D family protein [Phenylobacterium sp.]MBL8771093.1 alkaline phosphatase D family protein [Phenylobacterium sp.]